MEKLPQQNSRKYTKNNQNAKKSRIKKHKIYFYYVPK